MIAKKIGLIYSVLRKVSLQVSLHKSSLRHLFAKKVSLQICLHDLVDYSDIANKKILIILYL